MNVEAAVLDAMPPVEGGIESLDPLAADAVLNIGVARAEAIEKYAGTSVQGYSDPDSITYRAHNNSAVGLLSYVVAFSSGIVLEPLATPTIMGMRSQGRVTGRLADTVFRLDELELGDRPEADAQIDGIWNIHNAVHSHLHATLTPEEAFRYSPFNEDNMIDTMTSFEIGVIRVLEVLANRGRPLSPAARREINQSHRIKASFIGLSPDAYPDDAKERVSEWFSEGKVSMNAAARHIHEQSCLDIPVPPPLIPIREEVIKPLIVAMDPEEVREEHGMAFGESEQKAAARAVELIALLTRPRLNVKNLDTVLYKLAAREEAQLRKRGLLPAIPDPRKPVV
jgi:hypothetical protein